MTVERVAVEELPPRQAKSRLVEHPNGMSRNLEMQAPTSPAVPLAPPTPEPPPPPQPSEPRAVDLVLSAFAAIGYALSARAILLLAIVGAFVLACMAMGSQTMASLYVLIAYALLAVIPVVALELRRRKDGP